MKGIKLCVECANYSFKAHRCKIGCKKEEDPGSPFYDDCPLPDVAPTAEVARLRSQVNRLKKYDEERDIALHSRLISETRQKVAREIFEDIQRLLDNHCSACMPAGEIYAYVYYEGHLGEAIDELKKKYEGGESK